MISSVSNDINLEKVDVDINSILNDIKGIMDGKSANISMPEIKIDQDQCKEIAGKLMQVC